MALKNKFPELIAERFPDGVNISQLHRDTKMTNRSISDWVKGRVTRIDLDVLEVWCKYLKVQPGDILIYEED